MTMMSVGPKSRALLSGIGLEELAEMAKPPEPQKPEAEVKLAHAHVLTPTHAVIASLWLCFQAQQLATITAVNVTTLLLYFTYCCAA